MHVVRTKPFNYLLESITDYFLVFNYSYIYYFNFFNVISSAQPTYKVGCIYFFHCSSIFKFIKFVGVVVTY